MEGLLPMVYRTIKKNRTRRQYEYLSSGATDQTYNVADFHVNHDNYNKHADHYGNIGMQMIVNPHHKTEHGGFGVDGMTHRRRNSIHVDYLGRYSPDHHHAPASSRKLVRFRSARLFSCVTGA